MRRTSNKLPPCGSNNGIRPRHCWHHTRTITHRAVLRNRPGESPKMYVKTKVDTCCHCGHTRRRKPRHATASEHGPYVEVL